MSRITIISYGTSRIPSNNELATVAKLFGQDTTWSHIAAPEETIQDIDDRVFGVVSRLVADGNIR